MNIYVGNMSYDILENELRDIFTPFGEVSSVKIISDRDTGRPKGFGFVEMPNQEEAQNAISNLNDKEVKGRSLKVNEARPKEANGRPRRSPRY